MRILADLRRGLAVGFSALLAAGFLGVSSLQAQTPRDVVSKSVSVGRDGATLHLEVTGAEPLEISLAEGRVRIGGDVVGAYTVGDELDAAWRSLLGSAVALDDGPLGRALVDWMPPEGLDGDVAEAAARIDDALETTLSEESAPGQEVATAPAAPREDAFALRSLVSLLDRSDALAGLAEALEDLDLEDIRIAVGEDLTIEPGEDVDATVVVVDADLEIAGRVRGDVVVIDGEVRLAPGGRVDGDVRYAQGTVVDRGGRVDGEIFRVEAGDREMERRLRDEIRSEIRSEIRAATGDVGRSNRGESFFGRVFGGIGGVFGHLFTVLVVAVIGAVVVHFAGPNLDAVAETARRTPGRALTVGTAGAFLILPAFVLGIVALAISIIGIPALILWVPLFPVAIVLSVGLGYLAVFRNVGIWVARQRLPYLGWVRLTNPVTLIAGGALALTAPLIAAELVSVFPWTGALEVLLAVTGFMLSLLTALLGFGAVLLTRGGRKPEFFDDDLFGGWEPGGRPSTSGPTGDPFDAAAADWADDGGAEESSNGSPEPAHEGAAPAGDGEHDAADASAPTGEDDDVHRESTDG